MAAPRAPRRIRRAWARRLRARPPLRIALAVGLAAALAAVAVAQSVQLERHRATLGNFVATNSFLVSQLDYELQRLQRALIEHEAGLATPEAVRLRFEVFWSRILVVRDARIGEKPEIMALLDEIETVLAALEPRIMALEAGDRAATRAPRVALRRFEKAVHDVHVLNFSSGGYARIVDEMSADRTDATLLRTALLAIAALIVVYLMVEIGVSRRAARREARARRMAERAGAARQLLLTNMSHELRTPLNGLLGVGVLLRGTRLDDRQRLFADMIVQSAQALTTVISGLLNASSMERGGVRLRPASFALRRLFEEAADLFRPAAEKAGLALRLEIAPGVPDRAYGDRYRLRQVVTNLLGNAFKFSERGEVALEVDAAPEGAGLRLTAAVSDQGPGVPECDRERIFHLYDQGGEALRDRPGGMGAGLFICRTLVEAMDGAIRVESAAGGARFVFDVRLEAAEKAAEADDARDTDARAPQTARAPSSNAA